ncbi:hypothetical protein ABT368_09860 [Streptomyces althioticus]|uniref:hypothetical protein n=1 Tax=Streptomyces TaxID=1883 RepID=UPI000ABE7784|nr:hypothetical protein [Streptomyces sp. MNU103]WTB47829.1 hypothetical protein OG968_16920 [Streptomyces althioticus]WTB93711.1 hypothetical protein OHA53_18670 [Streptomyces althioticus]WTC24130.1 hypothetical protein OG872_16235 [Streptomyces althioticus]
MFTAPGGRSGRAASHVRRRPGGRVGPARPHVLAAVVGEAVDAVVRPGEAAGCDKVQLPAADDAYVRTFHEACGLAVRAQGFRRCLARPE